MLGVRTLSISAIGEVIVCSEPNKEATTTSASLYLLPYSQLLSSGCVTPPVTLLCSVNGQNTF